MFDAVIFDFDGLILDTETPLYVAWQKTYDHFGAVPIPLTEWSASIGLHDDDPAMIDPLQRLIDLTGTSADRPSHPAHRKTGSSATLNRGASSTSFRFFPAQATVSRENRIRPSTKRPVTSSESTRQPP
jgi:phosphoglycolate phosphatase-like HAD superfamily hydrolase